MQADPLDGTRWALEYLTLDGVSHLVSGRRIPELAFLDGRVSCDDGVNLGEGTYDYRTEAMSLRVHPTTHIPYPTDPLVEHRLFDHFERVRVAVLHGDFLHLRLEGHGDELVYHYEAEEAPA